MTLDPATTALLTELSSADAPLLHQLSPQDARAISDALMDLYGPGPELERVDNLTVPTIAGYLLPLRMLVPTTHAPGIIVYFHGGGWVVGSLDGYDTLARQLADRTGCTVALVDYRLAPEHPFPAAYDDACTAVEWVATHRSDYADADASLIVAGDSAGGNLAAVVAQTTAHRRGPVLALQVLIYPVTDDNFDTPSYRDPTNALMLTREMAIWFWDQYVPNSEDRARWQAAPSKADSLAGVAPTAILIAEHDVLRDENHRYATALRAADVPVREQVFEGQMHGFFQFVNVLPGAAQGLDYVVEAVDDAVLTRGITR